MPHVDPLAVDSPIELFLRLGLAVLLGLLLGLDREMKGHDAGIRTHALVALSSAMIMISSLLLFAELRTGSQAPDPLRAVQGLSQAIGFIAAGLIFVRGGTVRNMTTAANIWVAAAIGIACGAGQYALVLIGAGLAVLLVTLVKLFERWLPAEKKASGED
jgi:putative Mg2+ transporter-C (MgtC) family protein